jgi:hypothetical protein
MTTSAAALRWEEHACYSKRSQTSLRRTFHAAGAGVARAREGEKFTEVSAVPTNAAAQQSA